MKSMSTSAGAIRTACGATLCFCSHLCKQACCLSTAAPEPKNFFSKLALMHWLYKHVTKRGDPYSLHEQTCMVSNTCGPNRFLASVEEKIGGVFNFAVNPMFSIVMANYLCITYTPRRHVSYDILITLDIQTKHTHTQKHSK